MLIPNQRSAGLAIAFKIVLYAAKYLDGHDGSMFADMGLVLVLDFADVGDIGEQFVEGVATMRLSKVWATSFFAWPMRIR